MSEDVQVKFGASTGEAEAGVERVGRKLKDLDAPVREVLESFGELRKTFIEAFAVHEIAEFVEHMAEMGEAAVRNSAMLGISVEKVQELGFAARMVGGDSEGMAMSMMRLERGMAEAREGSGKTAQAFQALGISQQQLRNSSPEQVLYLIADSFHGAKDGADKTAIAMDLMGRMGAQMIPLLDEGSQGLKRMGVAARETGSILTDMQAEGLEKTAQSITTLKASFEGAGVSLMEVFKPAVDAMITGLTEMIQVFRAVIELINVAVEAIEGGLLLGLAAVIEKAEEMAARVGNAFNTIKLKAEEVGAVLSRLAHADLQGAVDAQVAGEKAISQAAEQTRLEIASLGKQYEDLRTKIEAATEAAIKNTLGIGGDKEGEEDKRRLRAPSGAKGAEDDTETQIAVDRIKTEEELAKIGLQTQKDMLDQEVAAKKISKAEEFATLESYLQLEYQVEKEALEKKLDLYASDTREYAATRNQMQILDAKYEQQQARLATQGAQAQAEATKKMAAGYKGVTDVIGRSFDTMLAGVLQGTQTWQVAMSNMFSNLAVSAVEAIAKIVAEWLVFEIATEGQGTWSDFMTLEKPGGGGISSLLPSFDVGSWSVPGNMVAKIHQGEMIIPAQQARDIRAGQASVGSGGGGQTAVTINISAIDTQSGAQFLKQHAGVIAHSIAGQMRNGNTALRNSMR